MATQPDSQPHNFTIFDLLAWLGAAAIVVACVVPALKTGSVWIAVVAVVLGVALIPVAFVGAWYVILGGIVAGLWLFSVDRDFAREVEVKNPIFPAHWWDFRPFFVIGIVVGLWLALGMPALGHLTPDNWPAVLILGNIVPVLLIGFATRHWWPAPVVRFFTPIPGESEPPAWVLPPDDPASPPTHHPETDSSA